MLRACVIVAPARDRRRIARRRAPVPAGAAPDRRTTVLLVRRGLIAVGIAFVAVLMLAAPAGAHAVLQQTQPVSGQAYSTAPPTMSLSFDEHVQVGLGGV